MEITPLTLPDRQVIQSYGDGGFRIAGVRHVGSVLVFARRTLAWPVAALADLDVSTLREVIGTPGEADLLLIGLGAASIIPDKALRATLRSLGVPVETMSTSAAARTFNVLLAEERKVAAALIAVA